MKEHKILDLHCIAGRSGLSRKIINNKISHPGLALTGFFEEFAAESIQLFGHGEQRYMAKLDQKKQSDTYSQLLDYCVPCCIFCDGGKPTDSFIHLAEETSTPVLVTSLPGADFSRRLYGSLGEIFAPTMTIHGVLVEVFGIGVLITAESGTGKSETALELIERGHRLISDDSVKLKNIGDSYLIGMGENSTLAHHMEIRGIGIINISTLFGIGAIREKKQIQLSIHLEEWDSSKNYDRVGEKEQTDSFLGIQVPKLVIPIKPGRNIPVLIETAARNERLKKLGYYSAKEFDRSVLKWLESETARNVYYHSTDEE